MGFHQGSSSNFEVISKDCLQVLNQCLCLAISHVSHVCKTFLSVNLNERRYCCNIPRPAFVFSTTHLPKVGVLKISYS